MGQTPKLSTKKKKALAQLVYRSITVMNPMSLIEKDKGWGAEPPRHAPHSRPYPEKRGSHHSPPPNLCEQGFPGILMEVLSLRLF